MSRPVAAVQTAQVMPNSRLNAQLDNATAQLDRLVAHRDKLRALTLALTTRDRGTEPDRPSATAAQPPKPVTGILDDLDDLLAMIGVTVSECQELVGQLHGLVGR